MTRVFCAWCGKPLAVAGDDIREGSRCRMRDSGDYATITYWTCGTTECLVGASMPLAMRANAFKEGKQPDE